MLACSGEQKNQPTKNMPPAEPPEALIYFQHPYEERLMGDLLWQPPEERVRNTNMRRFMDEVNRKFNRNFNDYEDLYRWSVDNIADFWATVWDFADIKVSRNYDEIVDDLGTMIGVKWFSGAKLNFAENLLRYKDDKTALIFKGEGQTPMRLTYAMLYAETARVAKALREMGVTVGDRVTGFMPNMPETIIAMLATVSIGAVWSSCSPDFGAKGVLDRFGQIRPKVLFAADGYYFKGNKISSLERISKIANQIDSVEKVIIVSYLSGKGDPSRKEEQPEISGIPNAISYNEFKSHEVGLEMEFTQLPFEHPLYIMYSSGTTGLPKCMVQSAGGILIHHLKELILHTDLKRDDIIFYYTTCGWMMWNWLTSSLAVGATLVLYDGNPFYPDPGVLWKLVQDEKITVFGTSAGYITALRGTGVSPGREYNLTSLKTVLSTGSPLSVDGFKYIYREIKGDIQLASISGGSDLNGCFMLGNPMGAVYSGELQCRGLAMDVAVFDEEGKPVINKAGELVCRAPFPSMPIYFWDDPGNKKYLKAYFDDYKNVWRHGDYIKINHHGGVIVYGRSDTTLNPGGVRIGTADIYRLTEQVEEIDDSLVVGQNWENDVRVILFVKMAEGIELTEELESDIKKLIRDGASPRHVPDIILMAPDIPYTLNMKKVELAVKKIIHNQPVLNKDALKNPESLIFYENLQDLSPPHCSTR